MKFNIYIARLIKFLLVIVVLLAVVHSILLFANIKITSDKARHVLADLVSTITQRETFIEGQVQITVSLLPEVIAERIHIRNTKVFDEGDFVFIDKIFVKISLLDLLTGDLVFHEIEAKHVQVSLVQEKEGSNNWSFEYITERKGSNKREQVSTELSRRENRPLSLTEISLEDIHITYEDKSTGAFLETQISELELDNSANPSAKIIGSFQGHQYEFDFKSASIDHLVSGQPWGLQGTGTLAGSTTMIDATMQFVQERIKGNIDTSVKNVNAGLLLEEFGLVADTDAASSELIMQIETEGHNITDALKKASIKLELHQGWWRWHALLQDELRELKFSKVTLNTSWDKPVMLQLDGTLFEDAVKLHFITNRLSEFFDEVDKLDVDLSAQIADSEVSLKGNIDLPVDKGQFQLDVSLMGKNLENLNRILNSELPPFHNYSLSGNLISNQSGYVLRASDATIGDTHFNGIIVIDTSSFKPFWKINLNSRQLQIKDFEFIELDIEDDNLASLKDAMKRTGSEPDKQHVRRLKKIVDNPRMHADLSVYVEQVMAGESGLGSSSIRLKLRDDTLILEDAEINVPGGKIKSAASFLVKENEVTGLFKLDIDKFEYGAVARYFKPGSPEGGVISTRINVQLAGPDFMHLFDNANGKIDVALWPRNTKTRIFDLWATNLFLIILPEIKKKESTMNCMVALMDIDDGIMKEDFFGIDTTRVWMTGNITVDFKQEHVSLSLYPRSKAARMFAVQAPIRAQGNFDDISLVTSPIDLTGAYISFVTSPLHVPARRIFGRKVPEDASEACERFFDREYVKQLKARIEAEEKKEIEEWMESD